MSMQQAMLDGCRVLLGKPTGRAVQHVQWSSARMTCCMAVKGCQLSLASICTSDCRRSNTAMLPDMPHRASFNRSQECCCTSACIHLWRTVRPRPRSA